MLSLTLLPSPLVSGVPPSNNKPLLPKKKFYHTLYCRKKQSPNHNGLIHQIFISCPIYLSPVLQHRRLCCTSPKGLGWLTCHDFVAVPVEHDIFRHKDRMRKHGMLLHCLLNKCFGQELTAIIGTAGKWARTVFLHA